MNVECTAKARRGRPIRCTHCREKGHYKYQCPELDEVLMAEPEWEPITVEREWICLLCSRPADPKQQRCAHCGGTLLLIGVESPA
jgi:hypothetical protein